MVAFADGDGHAEVTEFGAGAPVLDAVVHEQDVGRLDVPVDDAVVVDVRKTVGEIVSDQRHVGRRQRALGRAAAQVGAADEFHHQITEPAGRVTEVRAGVEQCHEGMVGHPRQDPHFIGLPAGPFFVHCPVAEEFDCHFTPQDLVRGTVHARLAAPANEFFDPVAPAEQETGVHGCQRSTWSL